MRGFELGERVRNVCIFLVLFSFCSCSGRWVQEGNTTVSGDYLELKVRNTSPPGTVEFPIVIYVLRDGVDPGASDRGALSIEVDGKLRLAVLGEEKAGAFTVERHRSHEPVPYDQAELTYVLSVPTWVLPQEPYRIWVGSNHIVRIDGITLEPKRTTRMTPWDPYRYALVVPTPE